MRQGGQSNHKILETNTSLLGARIDLEVRISQSVSFDLNFLE
jgi:hypothetical protein